MAPTVPGIFHNFISCKMNNIRENIGYEMCYAKYYWKYITDEEMTNINFSFQHHHQRVRILSKTLDI